MFVVLLLPAARPASAEFDLANAPSDNLVLEQILIQKLLAGHYQDALDTGLPHLDPFSMSLANLRLLIQAARFEREFDLAHELIGLGRLIYPSEPSLELEDRLLRTAVPDQLYADGVNDYYRPVEDGIGLVPLLGSGVVNAFLALNPEGITTPTELL